MKAALVGLALALAAGCGDPDQFALHLTWSDRPGRQTCPQTAADEFSCRAIPVSCDARVRLRIVDDADDTQVHYSECFDLPAGGDLCGLADLRIPSNLAIPNGMVRIQMQVWSYDQLRHPDDPPGSVPACPVAPGFDQRGLPLLDAPTPAVGGEIYFPVGESAIATLELGCPDYDQLDTQECRNRSITVDAAVLVPGAWRSVNDEEAATLDVRFGAPERGDDGLWRLPQSSLTELTQTSEGELRWRGSVAGPIEGLYCLHVLQTVAMATAVATCQVAAVLPSAALPMTGFRVERTQINKLTALANGLTGGIGFPLEGMVLGLVVDNENHPKPGVVVTPSEGSVVYPNADLDGLEPGRTGMNGLFMALDTPLGTTWSAIGDDGSLADGSGRGGLITDHVTVVVIRMNPASAGKP